ncbi:hypothetical protein NBRC116188_30400 [Oceaniserpentilla sp. 4NH20-0058]
MLAGILSNLGVFIGDEASSPNFEDRRFSQAIEKTSSRKSLIKEYNDRFPIWGFKHPTRNFMLLKKIKEFKNPLVIHISRDSVAVSSRTSSVYKDSFESQIKINIKNQAKLTLACTKIKGPVLYCSYEKILHKPEDFLTDLISVLKIDVSEEMMVKTVKFIKPEPIEYTNWAQHSRSSVIGFIDRIVDGKTIEGWAIDKNSTEPVSLAIKVNSEIKAYTVCNIFQKGLESIHPTGHCAFSVTLDGAIEKGVDQLEVITKDSETSLLPSEYIAW